MVRSQGGADHVNRVVAPLSHGTHLGKNRLGVVHAIVDDDFTLIVVKTMEATDILLERPAPVNEQGQHHFEDTARPPKPLWLTAKVKRMGGDQRLG